MNKKRLDEIRARAEAATPGPWQWADTDAVANFRAHARQDVGELLKHIEIMGAGDGLSDALLQVNLTTMKVQNRILNAQKKQIEKLQKYVRRLEEIEQIYKRGNEDYEKRIAKLLERVERMGKAIQSASYAKYLLSREDNA